MKKSILSTLLACALLLISFGCKDSKGDPIADVKIETYFDMAYLASNGFEDLAKTKATSDGKPVRVLKDVVGTKDAKWVGDLKPGLPSPIWTTPPVFHTDEMGGYILVPNVSYTWWQTDKFTAIPQPYDVYIVMRDLQAVPYEGYVSAGMGVRNKDDHLELKIDSYNSSNVFTSTVKEFATNSGVPPKNKMAIIRMQFNGANSKIFINNVQVPGTVDLGTGAMFETGYGTLSHAAQHDFYGMWIKFGGLLSDADHAYVYGKLSTQFNPGSYPKKPIADNIIVTWNTTTKSWDAKYTYVSPDGTAEDLTKTEYKWGFHKRYKGPLTTPPAEFDLDQTNFFTAGTSTTGKSLLRSAVSSLFTSVGLGETEVFVSVKVYDTKGNSWDHMVRSQFAIDDIP